MIWPTSNAEIIKLILSHEGGYVNHSSDKGGSTNLGITIDTLASFRKLPVTDKDIQNLSVKEASAVYLQKYIVGPGFDQLTDIRLRTAMVDYGVLLGPMDATYSLQAILGVKVDGWLGPKTAAKAAISEPRGIINKLSADRIDIHAKRVTKRPDQLVFLRGWISRALSFVE